MKCSQLGPLLNVGVMACFGDFPVCTAFDSPLETETFRRHFTKCCKDSGVLMVVKCRKENSALKDCLTSYYKDPAFYEECKMEYLKEREEFRRTGIPTKKRLQKLPTSFHMNITRQCID
uniref:COX assembly mitochondrial protein n=1 Tax=Capra hircus TaxID=9925 RepID=A0A8C2RXL9_CAPHI